MRMQRMWRIYCFEFAIVLATIALWKVDLVVVRQLSAMSRRSLIPRFSDVKMTKRSSKRGQFWGCKNYPKCHQMLNLRRLDK